MSARRNHRGWIVAAAIALLLGLAGLAGVAGCGDAGSERVSYDSDGSSGPSTTVVWRDEGSGGASQAPVAGMDQDVSSALGSLAVGTGQKIITTAQLDIEVESGQFQTAFNQALLLADRYGGYVVSSNSQASGAEDSMKSGTVTLRIPVTGFSTAMGEARKLGEVKNQSIGTEDVTEEYVDLEARITNSEANVRQLLGLLAKAKTVDEVLQVQSVLTSAQAELEQLKGRQRYLDEHTSYSTLSMNLYETGVETTPAGEWGFVGALKDALHNLVDAINQIVRGLGWLIPTLVVIAIVAFIAYLIGRKIVRRNRERERERHQSYQQQGWPGQPGMAAPLGAPGAQAPVAVAEPAKPADSGTTGQTEDSDSK
jgi:hypothetical protein